MNSKQRILAAIHLQEPDYVPCAPHIGVNMIEQMPAAEWQTLLHTTDVTMSVSALGDDQIWGGQYWLDHTAVSRQGNTITTTVKTPLGLLQSRHVVTREANWVAEHWYKSREDIDRLLSIPYQMPQFEVTRYFEWEERLGDEGLIALGIPSAFRFCLGLFGSEQLYYQIADDPDLVERLVATMNERLTAYIEACCEKGVRSFWMGGSEHCGPGVVHPGMFRRLITPYDRRIVEIIHQYGGIVNYHTHGKLKDILDDIAGMGVDVLSPIETGLRGDVTLAEAKARIGDQVCLKGNLDDMAFLALSPEQEVRQLAEEAIAQAAAGGGYILSGTDAGIYTPEWVQSFVVLAEVARSYPYA